MRVAVFSTKRWVERAFTSAPQSHDLEFTFLEPTLDRHTAQLAAGHEAICIFVNDTADETVLRTLSDAGVRHIALRCAGFNNVDLEIAEELGISVVRVPAYSPYAVAEHAVGLILTLNRRYHRAHNRVREQNFSLDGLLGFDLHGKRVGVIGTGRIGQIFARIMQGFGCDVCAYDRYPNDDLASSGVRYVELSELYSQSDIISLHCPLNRDTYHIINDDAVEQMSDGVMIINTSRGPLIDSTAVIDGLKRHRIGYLGLDVYEEEGDLFFEDLSEEVIQDDTFARLQTFPNVLITAHQAFFTREAVDNIAQTTIDNIADLERDGESKNQLRSSEVRK
jgi:D-lactate dehydrogenase